MQNTPPTHDVLSYGNLEMQTKRNVIVSYRAMSTRGAPRTSDNYGMTSEDDDYNTTIYQV